MLDTRELISTPLPVIALVSQTVATCVDRLTGDRSDYPLLVAAATSHALTSLGISNRIMYGPAAWIEILSNQQAIWAGCWPQDGREGFHFWVATQFGEVVDLNVGVACRKSPHRPLDQNEQAAPLYGPPLLWSAEVPKFYRYVPEGVAELDLTEAKDKRLFEVVLNEVEQKCRPEALSSGLVAPSAESAPPLQFINEPILCPSRKLLDDTQGTFKLFDRALSVYGIPPAPPFSPH